MIGTMNILAACSGPDSPVRKFVFKSSAHYYGCEQDDPAYLHRAHAAPAPAADPDRARHRRGREGRRSPSPSATTDVTVTTLRFVNGLGPALRTGHTALLSLPVVPGILGFDPRYQFIHEDDIVGVLEHAVREELPGVYNAAGDGVLVLSEVASLLGKPLAPLLPPWGTGLAAGALKRLGLNAVARDAQPAALRPRRSTTASSRRRERPCGHTTRETAQAFAEHLRIAAIQSRGRPSRTATSGKSRSSCATARACGERSSGPQSPRADRQRNCRTSSGYGPRSTIVRHVRSRSFFIVAAVLVLLLVAAGGVYAYDSGREDQIAKGISVGGVDVGGLAGARPPSSVCAPPCSSRSTVPWSPRTTASASR